MSRVFSRGACVTSRSIMIWILKQIIARSKPHWLECWYSVYNRSHHHRTRILQIYLPACYINNSLWLHNTCMPYCEQRQHHSTGTFRIPPNSYKGQTSYTRQWWSQVNLTFNELNCLWIYLTIMQGVVYNQIYHTRILDTIVIQYV